MIAYGKTAAGAIAAMTYLAAIHHTPDKRAGSPVIAEARNLSRPLVAKLLTLLATARLVEGTPGPGGGYRLSRSPADISLYEIVSLFEKMDEPDLCPFGPGWCGKEAPCPLHDAIVGLHAQVMDFLRNTTLEAFAAKTPRVSSSPPRKHRTR